MTMRLSITSPHGVFKGQPLFWALVLLLVLSPFVIYAVFVRSKSGSLIVGVMLLIPTAWWIAGGARNLQHLDDGLEPLWPILGSILTLLVALIGAFTIENPSTATGGDLPPPPPPSTSSEV